MAVDTRVLKLLKHNDPQQRRKAIIALADSRDKDALKPLDEVAKNDPEPKLRDLATRAQLHLKEHMEKVVEREAHPEAEVEVKVSERDMARAKGYMEETMSMMMAQDNAKAAKALMNALKANPNLKTDSYFLSLVNSVTGKPGEEGMAIMRSGEARGELMATAKQNKLQKRKTEHRATADEIGWSAAWFDLAVFAMVVAVITFFAPFVFTQLINNGLAYQSGLSAEKLKEETVKLPPSLSETTAGIQAAGAVALLGVAVGSGVGAAIGIVLFGVVVHLVATKLFGGNGTLPYMLSQLIPFYSMVIPVFFIWWCVIMVLISVGAGLIGVLCAPIMALAQLVVYFKAAGRVGNAYDFGALKGCLSMSAASILLSLVSSVLTYLLANTAVSAAMRSLGA